jgi:spore germination protein PC
MDWNAYVQRLCQAEQKIMMMSAQIADLQRQLNELKAKPPIHVEYHFDQLKVNRLEGTLNVGLSSQGIQELESLETPPPASWTVVNEQADASDEPIRTLQKEFAVYMDGPAAQALIVQENKLGVKLDEAHRTRVLEDVKKQLNERVRYYGKIEKYPADGTEEEREEWATSVKTKTSRDIEGAFANYLSRLSQTSPTEGG